MKKKLALLLAAVATISLSACAYDFPCSENSLRCSANDRGVEICTEGNWVSQKACETKTPFCNLGVCTKCRNDDQRCNAKDLEICTNGIWEVKDVCKNGQVCDADIYQCIEPSSTCEEDDKRRCTANADGIEICKDGRWKTTETCEEGKVCDADTFSCTLPRPPCTDNAMQCANNTDSTYLLCTNGTWGNEIPCLDNEICNPQTNRCEERSGTCKDAATQCAANGIGVETCKNGKWENTELCPMTTPACRNGKCVACLNNAQLCKSIESFVVCNSGTWGKEISCPDKTVCDFPTNQCKLRTGFCSTRELRCAPDGKTVETCNAGGWSTKTICQTPTPVCQSGQCVECTTDTHCPDSTCDTTTHACKVLRESTIVLCRSESFNNITKYSIGQVFDPRPDKDPQTITATIRCGKVGQKINQYQVIKGNYNDKTLLDDNLTAYDATVDKNNPVLPIDYCLWSFSLPGEKAVACSKTGTVIRTFDTAPLFDTAFNYNYQN